MPTGLISDLGELTGEEIVNLLSQLDQIGAAISAAPRARHLNPADERSLHQFGMEVIDVRADVLIQIARIRVPLIEAQNIIQRAVFRRGHVVPVARTT